MANATATARLPALLTANATTSFTTIVSESTNGTEIGVSPIFMRFSWRRDHIYKYGSLLHGSARFKSTCTGSVTTAIVSWTVHVPGNMTYSVPASAFTWAGNVNEGIAIGSALDISGVRLTHPILQFLAVALL